MVNLLVMFGSFCCSTDAEFADEEEEDNEFEAWADAEERKELLVRVCIRLLLQFVCLCAETH